MYRNQYYKKQIVELVRSNKNYVWINDNLSKFRLKVNRTQFERIFVEI